ncbi:MAG TPA: ABC transporter ATP-binding protein [Verrucomicrobiota bacterium]|nr:ABC transporter ATP-binding protein [Verrucomicrobiota bacterium]
MNQPAIEIQELKVRFSTNIVLDIDELVVNSGEYVVIMGPNGAGKSTLLKVCLGLHKKNSGVVKILGVNIDELNFMGLVKLRRKIGFTPQILPSRSQMPITTREVIQIGRAAKSGLLKKLTAEDNFVVEKWIRELGLSNIANRPFNLLSGGEQRKVMIARTMVQEPELLLLDEPTVNLDLGWRERIMNTLDVLHKKTGISILIVSHEVETITERCNRIILIENGKVVAMGNAAQVFTPNRIKSLYGIKGNIIQHKGRHIMMPEFGAADIEEFKREHNNV